MQKGNGGTAARDKVGKAYRTACDRLVLSGQLLIEGAIELVRRMDGQEDDLEPGGSNEVEELRRIDRNGFTHGGR
jgi:hypothetical protein